jgi:demethylmenaquinone methyltransferase/2-methoxy-6-polyprenyl-1,4-benzoquinol methylase
MMSEYDPDAYMQMLYLSNPLQDPLVRRVVRAAGLPGGSRGLDAGCGVGLQFPALAEAVGEEGRITGLDILPEFLEEAEKNAAGWGLSERVSLIQGDIYDLPFEDRQFDWIWSASCACYSLHRPLAVLQGLRRILRPGGLILILLWSGQQLLSGYPRLEACLNATSAGIAPFAKTGRPEDHFLRLVHWMRKAGFVEATAQPFTEAIHAPLDQARRNALLALIEMRWRAAEKELSRADRRLFRRITDPSSPEFILDQPGYYGFYTYSLFRAARARQEIAPTR